MITPKHMRPIVLLVFSGVSFLLLFYLLSPVSADIYPQKAWQISTPEEQGIDSQVLAEMLQHVKDQSYHFDSIQIVRSGHMVLDTYFWPFSKNQKHPIHSCTKSIVSALIGIAIDKGYIRSVDQPITDFFPGIALDGKDDDKASITLENLLTMASGLKCRDSYLYHWEGLFYMRLSTDWAQYVLDLPMIHPPGETFEYCNGVSHLLSVIIQNTTQMKAATFARKHLFEPLNIEEVSWETNHKDVSTGYGGIWLKPHDMAKFGWLYLNKGRWEEKQIVPLQWIEDSTRGHIDAHPFGQYGYQWWIDDFGYYMAVGFKGQRIFVVPAKEMVAVFTGDLTGREALMSDKLLDAYIIPAASSLRPLPPNAKEQSRLDALIKSVAKPPPTGITWLSETEGIVKDGVFQRSASPSFRFEYPLGSKKSAIIARGQVMRMKTPKDVDFSASVGDIPEGLELKDFGPRGYAEKLKMVGSSIKVISNEAITLKCGTDAYRTGIEWLWNNRIQITTFLVSGYKDGKFIFVCAHAWENPVEFESMVQSLTLKN